MDARAQTRGLSLGPITCEAPASGFERRTPTEPLPPELCPSPTLPPVLVVDHDEDTVPSPAPSREDVR